MINLGIIGAGRITVFYTGNRAEYGYTTWHTFHFALLVRLIFVCCTRIVSIVFYNTIPFKTIMI